mmetsp:Transcript_58003/g.127164  ORF Transcript_58003/g.127164 Transcript_58003/m.127164 type:complete len:671 (-) Transcript_58003:610-2622(-)
MSEIVELWKAFSPPTICDDNCLARTWACGMGGQCPRGRLPGEELCGQHSKQLKDKGVLPHGLVNGPIPAAKLEEFQTHAMRAAIEHGRKSELERTQKSGQASAGKGALVASSSSITTITSTIAGTITTSAGTGNNATTSITSSNATLSSVATSRTKASATTTATTAAATTAPSSATSKAPKVPSSLQKLESELEQRRAAALAVLSAPLNKNAEEAAAHPSKADRKRQFAELAADAEGRLEQKLKKALKRQAKKESQDKEAEKNQKMQDVKAKKKKEKKRKQAEEDRRRRIEALDVQGKAGGRAAAGSGKSGNEPTSAQLTSSAASTKKGAPSPLTALQTAKSLLASSSTTTSAAATAAANPSSSRSRSSSSSSSSASSSFSSSSSYSSASSSSSSSSSESSSTSGEEMPAVTESQRLAMSRLLDSRRLVPLKNVQAVVHFITVAQRDKETSLAQALLFALRRSRHAARRAFLKMRGPRHMADWIEFVLASISEDFGLPPDVENFTAEIVKFLGALPGLNMRMCAEHGLDKALKALMKQCPGFRPLVEAAVQRSKARQKAKLAASASPSASASALAAANSSALPAIRPTSAPNSLCSPAAASASPPPSASPSLAAAAPSSSSASASASQRRGVGRRGQQPCSSLGRSSSPEVGGGRPGAGRVSRTGGCSGQ